MENTFKQIQEAYTTLKTEESRREYDTSSSSTFTSSTYPIHSPRYPFYGSSASETLFESLYRRQHPLYNTRSNFGVHVTTPQWFQPTMMTNQEGPKSIFIQRVTVPLEELYQGISNKKITLQDGIIERYFAAFRGGSAIYLALQGLLTYVFISFFFFRES